MTTEKKTMYEILEVPQTASLSDIKAAHRRQALKIMSGATGLSRDECEFNLQLLDVALHTLSVPALRDAYDAELAVAPANMPVPFKSNIISIEGGESKALQIVAELEDSRKWAVMNLEGHQPQLKAASAVVNSSVKSMKAVFRTFIGLAILAFVLSMGRCGLASRLEGRKSPEERLAEDKMVIQEYYQIHGVRPASKAEAIRLQQDHQRAENEKRSAELEEKQIEYGNSRLAENAQREGHYIHNELEQAERYEEQKERREAQQREEEKQRMERQREAEERQWQYEEQQRLARALGKQEEPQQQEEQEYEQE